MAAERQRISTESWIRLYFIGIGGIGMSALARYFSKRGVEIYGYDRYRSALSAELEKEGMHIHYDIDPGKIPGSVDAVIYTPAIPDDQAELVEARHRRLPLFKRAELLGIVSRDKRCIAVAGTHGKTSSSIMLGHILHDSGFPVTAFLGGIAVNYNNNFLGGVGEWVVIEADEYDQSFLQLYPEIAVINSMDPDHLDVYGDQKTMIEHYFQFAKHIREGGSLYITPGALGLFESEMLEVLQKKDVLIELFGLEEGDHQGRLTGQGKGRSFFTVESQGQHLENLEICMPGVHNVLNATVAVAIALQLGVPEEAIRTALQSFRGIKRRFEYILNTDELVIIDDYAHHPAELKAVISAARAQFEGEEITVVFQPHLYSRTRDFAGEFARSLEGADRVILVEIYPAREEPVPGVNSEMLYQLIRSEEKYITSKSELIALLRQLDPGVLLTLGAGDLDAMLPDIIKELTRNHDKAH